MLTTLAMSGYRTLRDLVLPLERLTIVTGPNGSGKSSLYKSIRLLADVAQGRIIGSLAAEGGLSSTLWAGPEAFSRGMKAGETPVQGLVRKKPVALKLGFADEDYGYAIDLGLPIPGSSSFDSDPEIKAEAVWAGQVLARRNLLADRNGPVVHTTDADGKRTAALTNLQAFDSMMTHAADPRGAPELLELRERMRSWRFYDHFRTDRDAPARQPQIGTRTTALASDGSDLAAALATIMEIGDGTQLHAAIADAFPGGTLEIAVSDGGLFSVLMRQHGLLRPLRTAELSDGTLRYLLLVAALLTPRPPALLVLNEPETSLHPDLLDPLARLIAQVSARSQIIVVSHAARLVKALTETGLTGAGTTSVLTLTKELGETIVPGVARPGWSWPPR